MLLKVNWMGKKAFHCLGKLGLRSNHNWCQTEMMGRVIQKLTKVDTKTGRGKQQVGIKMGSFILSNSNI